MSKDKSLVRASDISAWVYCNRAWWLANVQGAPHEQPEMLAHGTAVHAHHGHNVKRSAQLQRWGTVLILLAVLLAMVALLVWIGARYL